MHLVRDLLDKQLVDSTENKTGKVDGLVFEVEDGSRQGLPRSKPGPALFSIG